MHNYNTNVLSQAHSIQLSHLYPANIKKNLPDYTFCVTKTGRTPAAGRAAAGTPAVGASAAGTPVGTSRLQLLPPRYNFYERKSEKAKTVKDACC